MEVEAASTKAESIQFVNAINGRKIIHFRISISPLPAKVGRWIEPHPEAATAEPILVENCAAISRLENMQNVF